MSVSDVFLSDRPDQDLADGARAVPSRAARERDGSDGEWGPTIRFYDREIDAWRSTWLGPRHHVVTPFIARRPGLSTNGWRRDGKVPEQRTSIHGRPVALIDAPSNLGLRPPADGASPGVYKLAGALRDNGLLDGLGALDAGVVVAPRYSAVWRPGDGVRNERAIERYSSKLADRIERLLDDGFFPVVLGGDCSVLIGNQLALRRRGRFGLAFIDGHSDFRHLGNSEFVGSAAGEDLAIVTGRGDALASIEGRGPLVRDDDVVVLGVRDHDALLDELQRTEIRVATAGDIARVGPASVATRALARLRSPQLAGFWIHCDFDVLDSSVMPAVDTPEPAGIDFDALVELLVPLLADERAVGVEFTIFDPDLDEDGELAAKLTGSLCRAFASATAITSPR